MNKSILTILGILISCAGLAQTKGFFLVKTKPPFRNFQALYDVARCLEWSSSERTVESCRKFEALITLNSDRHEPALPGFYKVQSRPVGDDLMVEIKANQVVNLDYNTFNPTHLVKLIPSLEYYLKQDRYSFYVQRDFTVKSYQLSTEKETREAINAQLNTSHEQNPLFCKTKKTVLELVHEGKVRICYNGKSREVAIKVYPEVHRILDLINTDISQGININTYDGDGLYSIPRLVGLQPLTTTQ